MIGDPDATANRGFHPWHFFALTSLAGATVAVLLAGDAQRPAVILLSAAIGAAGVTGLALYRTLAPVAGRALCADAGPLGPRTRAALEREKAYVLRAIKELEFDRAMRKIAPQDYDEIAGRLRARALRLIRQLDDERTVSRRAGETDAAT